MDADSWGACLTSASKRYQSALQTRPDVFMVFEEIDGDDDIREEFPRPFCSEYFDIVGLCIHLDKDHQVEAKNGMQWKRKSRKSGSHSNLSFLRRELRDGTLKSLLGGSSCMVSLSSAVPDPLLSALILPVAGDTESVRSKVSTESGTNNKSLDEAVPERKIQTPPLSNKDREERAKQCKFVLELLSSTVLADGL